MNRDEVLQLVREHLSKELEIDIDLKLRREMLADQLQDVVSIHRWGRP